MAIKFGDTLENQNTNYPIVDVVGDNVAGVHVVDDFANDHLIAIPTNARRTGSIVVAKDTGKVYIFKGTGGKLTGNANSSDNWGHAAGTNWVKAGDTTLGTPTDGSLTDGNPAISSFTANTLIVDAIDLLNETLGALVPTAPSTWAAQDDSLAFAFSTTAARLVGKNNSGNTISHVTNSNSVTTTPGTAVNWFVDTGAIDFSRTFSFADNDQEQTQFRFHLNDEVVELASATATSATLASGDNSYGGSMTINVTTGNFPTTGDSAGFYTGVDSVDLAANAITSTGFNVFKFDDQGGNNAKTQTIYIADDSSSAGFVTSNDATQLIKTANGTAGYTSGLPCFKNPTFKLKVTTSNLIPLNALVYGTTSNVTDNNCVQFTTGSVANAPSALTYADLPNSTNSNVQQGDNFTNHEITGISVRADQYRFFNINTDGGPNMQGRSIHGNSSVTTVGTGTAEFYAFYDQPSQSSTLLAPFENDLYNTLHTADTAGARVKDPDSNGNSTDTPADAVGSYGAWSQQYGNNSSGSLSIKNHDAITAPMVKTGTDNGLRCTHNTTNYNVPAFVFAGNTSSTVDFSTRTSNAAQYVTYAFPCNQPLASFTLKFQGDLDNGGDVWFKMFDASADSSVATTNSSTGGWVPATVAYAGSGIAGAGGTGCAAGGVLSTDVTTLQTITITAGLGRWNNGSDEKVYVRVKLMAGDYIEKIGLFE